MVKSYFDQMNREVRLSHTPERIISFVPSLTELLCDLGLRNQLVGVTKFCIHPSGLRKEKEVIGSTKKIRREKIISLQPDLIIGNKEENTKEDVIALESQFPVWISDVSTLADAWEMVEGIGKICGKAEEARVLIQKSQQAFSSLPQPKKRERVLYFIWKKPWMVAGRGTYTDQMLQLAGFDNAVSASRYPALDEAQIRALQPDRILLSSEPFPFKDKHVRTLEEICPQAHIQLVDGEMFTWYGSRMLKAADYIRQEFL